MLASRAFQARSTDQLTSRQGFWTWDIRRDRIFGCANLIDYFGFEIEDAAEGLALSAYTDRIVAEDRQRITEAIGMAVEKRTFYRETYAVNTRTHGRRTILAHGRCFYNGAGEPSAFPGSFFDVTEGALSPTASLLHCHHLTELARDAAARSGNEMLNYFLEMALLEMQDKLYLTTQGENLPN